MSVQATCPQCTSKVKAPDKYAGREAKCPKCAGPVLFPPATQPPQLPPDDIQLVSDDKPHHGVVQSASRRSHSFGVSSLVIAIVGLLLVWVPGIGLLLGLLACGLAAASISLAVPRGGSGIGFGIAGGAIGVIVTFIGGIWTVAIGHAITVAADHNASSVSSGGWPRTPLVAHADDPAVALSHLPNEQRSLAQIVDSCRGRYESAPNELKKSAIRADRRTELANAIADNRIENWRGVLVAAGTQSDGKAHVEIRIDGSRHATVKTWNNALSDLGSGTLVEISSPLYASLADLSPGDHVTFSGELIASPRDHFKECSLTEAGSMEEPSFLVRFSKVSKSR
ncbi:MAG TPA: hypothetical protein VGG30_07930 [Pirellulales bacterium]|jgi:hypothetical protein